MKSASEKLRPQTKLRTRRAPRQLSFISKLSDVFVGPRRGTHSKVSRPLNSNKPLHICFRSKLAEGKRTLLGANKLKVKALVDQTSQRFGVKILKYSNVGNHLHLVVKLPGSRMTSRRQYSKWIRLLTSRIAFTVGGARKGEPLKDENGKKTKFWDSIPFSRVIHGRSGWRIIDRYILKNDLEAEGYSKETAIILAAEFFDSSRALQLPDW